MNATADAPAVALSSAPGRWVLAITVLGSGLAALDATVVNIALPAIGREFHTGVALQWVMNGYALALAALLLIGGATGAIDYAGALAGVVFLTGVTFAFIEAPVLGWSSPAVLAMTLAGVAGLAAFLAREHRAAAPMLPLTVILLGLSARSGTLAARIGPRLQLSVGPATAGAGLAMLTLATSGSSYLVHVLPAVVVLGLGLAITTAPLTATAMNSAPAQHSGIASAINNDMSRFGGLLAVAVLPALAGITGTAYLQPDTLAAGFRTAALISAGMCAAGGLLAAAMITNPPRAPRPGDAAAPEECFHRGLDAPPLITSVSQTTGTGLADHVTAGGRVA